MSSHASFNCPVPLQAPKEGWAPQHVTVRDVASGALLGCVPLFLKGHSYGEYVFDSSWANYSHMMGRPYYPKLQVCVPFTPVTGPRLLVAPGPSAPLVTKALAQTLVAIAGATWRSQPTPPPCAAAGTCTHTHTHSLAGARFWL